TRFSRDWSSDVCSSDLHSQGNRLVASDAQTRLGQIDHCAVADEDFSVLPEASVHETICGREAGHRSASRRNLGYRRRGEKRTWGDRKSTRLNSSHVKIS